MIFFRRIWSRILVVALLVVGSIACERSVGPDELDRMLADYRFTIEAISYGGLVGETRATYQFSSFLDSMDVYLVHHTIRPKEKYSIRIPKAEYDQLIANLHCMSRAHQDKLPTRKGCSPPWDREYFIRRGIDRLRIFPADTVTCSIEDILYPYLLAEQQIEL
ncbi:hypothetical protein [Flavilitoribacter nigricans]|nr:hypothetical protein [Flavilitoribacter nigricans]